MLIFKRLFLSFIFMLFSVCVFAADYTVQKLPNGQTLVIYEIHNNPIVTIDTWIKTGSINEDESNTGISHFLEHLFFKGTQAHPAGDFDRILESKGAITNAATSKDFTHYYITIASNYFDLATELHADMLLHPQIPEKEMEKERKVVLEEIAKSANVPETQCYENLVKMMYTTHPYKRRVLGSEKIIENVTREEILKYYNTYYSPANMVTLIVGDVEPEKALAIVKKNFNTPYRKPVVNSYKREKLLTEQKRNILHSDISTGYMLMGYRSANISENDTYALDVLATILGSGRTSRLYRNIKDEKQLVNSIASYNSTMRDDGLFVVKATFLPENMQLVENAVYDEINKLKTDGITDIELNTAKKMIESTTYYERESVSNIATEMGYLVTLTGDTKYYDDYLNNINKVTADDVKRVANKYLQINNSAISVVLPKSFEGKNCFKKVSEVKNIAPSAKIVDSNKKTDKYLYDNGLTLLMSDTSYNDIIAISIVSKGGYILSPKRGVGSLYGDLLLKGTKTHTAKELAQITEEKGIHISTSSSADSFRIDVLTTKTYLDTTMDILNEILTNSIFDEKELEKIKKMSLNNIKQTRDNPLKIALDEFRNKIYGDSVYNSSTFVLEKTIPTINRNDVVKYGKEISNPKNIVISVTGNIDNKTDLINKLGLLFNQDGQKFDYSNYSIPKLTSKQLVEKKLNNQKTAWLILGWRTNGLTDLKEYATLNIINTMLGSGMSSRLFVNLREAEGLAYQLGSSYSPSMLAGNFIVYIGTNPNSLNHAGEKLLAEINKLKTELVSDKELQEAKDRLPGQYVIALETNSDKASTLCWFEASGRGFGFIDKYPDLIKSVTATDIIEVANKYFNNNYVKSVITGREK